MNYQAQTETMLSNPPKGFTTVVEPDTTLSVGYRTTGMNGAKLFFAVWIGGWTAGCLFFSFITPEVPDEIRLGIALFISIFWVIDIGTILYVAWFFLSRRTYRLGDDALTVTRELLGYKKEMQIRRDAIERIEQIKDGGEGEDSFPSWGLVVHADKNYNILQRQEIAKSAWLGGLIAEWAGCAFDKYEDPTGSMGMI